MATDDDDAATLRERVRELEATVAQQQDTIEQLMPSRRAILAGGAGLVGGAALTGQASAQSAAGQVGTASEPVDVEAFDVTVQNGLDMADNTISNVNGLTASSAVIGGTVTATDVNTDSVNTDSASVTNQLDAGSVNTETIGSERYYAGSYDGGDPDARLDNALSAASTGDVIYLENAGYLNTHTISTDGLTIFGTAARQRGTQINGGITVSADYVEFIDLYWNGGTHQLNGASNSIRRGSINSGGADITIDGVLSIVEGVMGGSVTLGSNSIQCVVDSCAAFSVTDNGSNNVVGDLS